MKYKATVITPFHNTEMSMFKGTINSLLQQTVGFENIEWIIVLHNCAEQYVSDVKEILGKYDNVVLKELVNDARSASSPRNYALQFVTSPYVEFLDSDDTISNNTIETCLEKMEKHHAQMVVFRMSYAKQNESVQSIITDVTLWNPLEEEIVLTGDGLRRKELYTSINFCTHNRFFDADFLRDNNLCFEEEITMAEDAYFTLSCYAKAEKIVVLPKFIGHCYFVNSASAVQSMQKTSKQVLHFSYGFKKMFDLLLEMNAYYNHFFLTIMQAYIHYAFYSPDFTLEDWKTLQEDMRPYAELVTVPPVNKFFTKEEGKLIYKFVRHNILDEKTENDEDKKAFWNGENELLKIVKLSLNTDIARYYDFENIHSIEDCIKKVPLYDHNLYDELIRLQTQVGETQILSENSICAYAYDFNESDKERTTPLTDKIYEDFGKHFVKEIENEVTFLMMDLRPKSGRLNDGAFNDSVMGLMLRSGIGENTLAASNVPGKFSAPFELIFPQKAVCSDYLNMLFALRNSEVTQIYASNTWAVFGYINMLINNHEKLCKDIENGTVSIEDEETRLYSDNFAELRIPNPERSNVIRTAIEKNDRSTLLKQIWPNLKKIIARNGGTYCLYTDKVNEFIGDDVYLKSGALFTPYGVIAEETEIVNQYQLRLETNFFEFLPVSSQNTGRTVMLTEVKMDEIYELVITNRCGIYRMRTNIYVIPRKFGMDGFYFTESEKPLLVNDKVLLTGNEIYDALTKELGDALFDYYFFFDKDNNQLAILVELERDIDTLTIEEKIEDLFEINSEYLDAVNKDINKCKLYCIDKETRLLRRDIRINKFNSPGDSFETIRNIEDADIINMMKKWLM